MAFTRKQLVTCFSIVYILLITAFAGYAASRAQRLSLPIPDALSGFSTALPIFAGLVIESSYALTRHQERRRGTPLGKNTRPPLVSIANMVIFIYSTVVITLLGTHVAPASELDCRLRRTWETMFHRKDSDAIRTIQRAFGCCGLKNTRDMSWPFPDKSHDPLSCQRTFGWTNGCLSQWKREEQNVAGMFMGVVGLVWIWQLAIILIPTKRGSWLHLVVPDRISRIIANGEHGNNGSRRAIDYLPNFNRYTDDVDEEANSSDRARVPQLIDEGDAQQVNRALLGGTNEGQRHAAVDNEWAR